MKVKNFFVKNFNIIFIILFLLISFIYGLMNYFTFSSSQVYTADKLSKVENIEVKGNKITTVTNDPQIYVDSDTSIKNIRISINDITNESIIGQIFYYSDKIELSEQNSVLISLKEGKNVISIPAKEIHSIRIDIGNQVGETYILNKIVINDNSLFYKFFVLWIIFIAFVLFISFIYRFYKRYKEFWDKRLTYLAINATKYRLHALFGVISLFILIFILKVNFSNYSCYKDIFPNEASKYENYTIGVSRNIRGDEYGVITPIQLSQGFQSDKYPDTSDILGENIWMHSIGSEIPTKDISIIGKIFNWGFIMFGNEIGFSWFYVMRLLFLFAYSYLLLNILMNNKNKKVSIVFGVCITFSPLIQWWLTAQPCITEIFIYGNMIIVSLYYLFYKESKRYIQLINAMLLLISLIGFLFSLYPPGLIPMSYLILCIIIGLYLEKKSSLELSKTRFLILVLVCTIFFIISVISIYNMRDEIKLILNTVYPGKRRSIGGDVSFEVLYNYLISIFLPYKNVTYQNQTELSSFITLFPLPIIMYIKNKKLFKKSYIINSIMVFIVALSIFSLIGFPYTLSKITILMLVTSRAFYFVTYAMTILLFLIFADNKISQRGFISISIVMIIFIWIGIKKSNYLGIYLPKLILLLLLILLLYLTYCYLKKNNTFLLIMLIIAIISGCTVNPINFGTRLMTDTDVAISIRNINKDNPGLWCYLGNNDYDISVPKYILAQGVDTIGVYNFPPQFSVWSKLDNEGVYEDIYNRTAHVGFELNLFNNSEKFRLITPDYFSVYVTINDLKNLGVKYIVSRMQLEGIQLLYVDNNGLYIYIV